MAPKTKYIWLDGKLVGWDEANIHVLAHALHYGTGAFEGIRAYETHDGRSAVFRLRDHIRRLFDTTKILRIDVPFTIDHIIEACKETLSVNGLKGGYIRPIAFLGSGGLGLFPRDNPVRVAIAVWEWGAYLGETALTKGIRAKISSFNRFHPNSIMTRAKITGHYVTGVLAKREAVDLGYDEAILLDQTGFVAEGSGENIFMIRDGILVTTPLTNILNGITRKTIMTIAADENLPVEQRRFTRDELYTADEAFFVGTAAEVTPIREVDNRPIGTGNAGPITRKLQTIFFEAVAGKQKKYEDWLDYYEVKTP